MRKAITILMLSIAIIAGGTMALAKTTKKSNTTQHIKKTSVSSSSTFNLKTLASKFYNKNINIWGVSVSQLNSIMKELGFSHCGTPYSSSVYTEIDDSWDDVTVYSYSKGDVYAYIYLNDYGTIRKILLEFPSTSKANAFVSSSKSALGKALKRSHYGYHYNKRRVIWSMSRDGSTIEILLDEDMG